MMTALRFCSIVQQYLIYPGMRTAGEPVIAKTQSQKLLQPVV